MAPLSILPVFLPLQGRRAVVVGGSDAAAWKAELLVAAGAAVDLYASAGGLSDELKRVLVGTGAPGRIVHHDVPWDVASFADAAIVVADAETDDEARALHRRARAAGVPINVIDRPAFCDVMFGSIVNRSPVVVGISTEGAAPILGQAIRRRIETVLPPALQKWAGLAQRMRARLNARLQPGIQRRTFWERFADRAFGPAPMPTDEAALDREIDGIAAAGLPQTGRVTLVGAGPGDAALLTLKAVRALQSADTILFDDLVSDDVLELARREARRIRVGKRGGRPSCSQSEINALMVRHAKAGRHVVRLKAGDPMIFGRAGEEIALLDREGVPVDVVPGITSGIALASALGVSLTHRDHARSVRFVTGHSRKGGLPDDIDWAAVADPSTTTIFYMAGRTAEPIAERLTSHGMHRDTDVAVVSAVSCPNQRVWRCTLGTLARTMTSVATSDPVIIGIGAALGARNRDATDHLQAGRGLEPRDVRGHPEAALTHHRWAEPVAARAS
ncbi:siroheme synthase CysG [Marinivivus vitaminiproducens]|uniref:siroheme synthase CysG n=1 Tax=Marinivivus vitaminiproducens TaxID=3035935 RepID=UPI002797F404|nr:siroheme synthase CysG [Geminicoccaceae bacterium SCSIO 64248]